MDAPTLPNTGPGLALSFVNHTANPSPYNVLPLPFTYKRASKDISQPFLRVGIEENRKRDAR